MLASGSEDLVIDVSNVATGERIVQIPVETPTFTVAWHPRVPFLAYACDDKEGTNLDRDAGTVKLYGIYNDWNPLPFSSLFTRKKHTSSSDVCTPEHSWLHDLHDLLKFSVPKYNTNTFF